MSPAESSVDSCVVQQPRNTCIVELDQALDVERLQPGFEVRKLIEELTIVNHRP